MGMSDGGGASEVRGWWRWRLVEVRRLVES